MAQILRQNMTRHDDARSLLRAIYSTEVDIVPNPQANTLTIRLHPLATATKQYTDAGDALNLPLAGGTMTGDILLYAGAPAANASAVLKSYVDSSITTATANYLPSPGGTMTGDLVRMRLTGLDS
jgi:hypothetical protein